MDLIDRQDAIYCLKEELYEDIADDYSEGFNEGIRKAIWIVETWMPSAERKKGKWIYDENGMDWNLPAWICSECHIRNDNIPPVIKYHDGHYERIANPNMFQGSRFCPNCGADMRGEEDD